MRSLFRYVILLFLMLIPVHLFAQCGDILPLQFSSTTIDYGTIDEEGGMVTQYVEAVNRSATPIYIGEVTTSCGCTTADYTRDAIMPGRSVQIGITFDPRNRPGRFEREAIVTLLDVDEQIVLNIIGHVTPRERSVYEIYPFDMGGGLRMESNFHAFAYIEHGKMVEERIGYINNSDKAILLDMEYRECSGLLTVDFPRSIAPHDRGDITLRYALDEESEIYGTLSDVFQFRVDGVTSGTLMSTYAIAVDNFDLVEDILAPSAVVSKKIIKFGEILLDNKILEDAITLSNSGDSPLIIRRIEADSPAVDVEVAGAMSVAKGESVTLIIRLNTSLIEDCDNPYVSRVRVICNDPIVPMHTIRVTAIPL